MTRVGQIGAYSRTWPWWDKSPNKYMHLFVYPEGLKLKISGFHAIRIHPSSVPNCCFFRWHRHGHRGNRDGLRDPLSQNQWSRTKLSWIKGSKNDKAASFAVINKQYSRKRSSNFSTVLDNTHTSLSMSLCINSVSISTSMGESTQSYLSLTHMVPECRFSSRRKVVQFYSLTGRRFYIIIIEQFTCTDLDCN